ncbi:hypothetical protein AVEN_145662-1 [Araneus ventricosus]|uniref:Uncharacterized protein n=1 Tax=Araneus ventricosus TaxID=182803 RepID=A0A4Y2KWN0_ARAVE|nr:hypothetical protein AVEN_145662-1 [Araneus ventricosus]
MFRTAKHVHHSPDLAASDFHLCGPLKKHLVGRNFRTLVEVQESVVRWLRGLDPDCFYAVIDRLVYRRLCGKVIFTNVLLPLSISLMS